MISITKYRVAYVNINISILTLKSVKLSAELLHSVMHIYEQSVTPNTLYITLLDVHKIPEALLECLLGEIAFKQSNLIFSKLLLM